MTHISMRFYRTLLHLYPAGFRAEYDRELRATFADCARAYSGRLAGVRVGAAVIADVVPNAFAVHWDLLRQDLTAILGCVRPAMRAARVDPIEALRAE